MKEEKLIALIHGELSAEEIQAVLAEIESNPDVKTRYEELLELNQLLGQAAKPEKEEWRMEEKRRAALLETLSSNTHTEEQQTPVTPSWNIQWQTIGGIAACFVGTLVVSSFMLGQAGEEFASMSKNAEFQKIDEPIVSYTADSGVDELVALEALEAMEEEPLAAPPSDSTAGRVALNETPYGTRALQSNADYSVKEKVVNRVQKKGAYPSASATRIITAQAGQEMTLPTPEVEGETLSLDFGESDGFGDGWGNTGKKAESYALFGQASPQTEASSNGFHFKRQRLGAKAKLGNVFTFEETSSSPKGVFLERSNLGNSLADSNEFLYDSSNSPDYSDLAKIHVERRKAALNVDNLIQEAREAYKNKEYQLSSDTFKKALNTLPEGEILDDRRAFLNESLAQSNIALSKDLNRKGDRQAALATLEEVLKSDPANIHADKELEKLYDAQTNSVSVTPEHAKQVNDIRRHLYKGEGYYNLGQYDLAKKEFDKVIRKDPYNQAARRWQVTVNKERRDYYRSAYDATRSELLTAVDQAWEVTPPPVVDEDIDGKSKEELKKTIALMEKVKKSKARQQKADSLLGSTKEDHIDGLLKDKKLELMELKKNELAKPKQKAPTHDVKNLLDETTTAHETHSTFSLHVSDVSFKLAKSAMLDKGVLPDSQKIRPEEFVNAFDYGDPSVKGDAKVACYMEQAVHPFMHKRNLMRVSMSTAALGRSQPLRLTILLDNSGSMERADREASVIKAMEILVEQLKLQDEVSLISFAQTPRILAEGLKGKDLKKIITLVKQAPSEGGTNMEKALKVAGEVTKRNQKVGCQSRIVMMTDGAANLGNAEPEELKEMIIKLRQQNIAFDACGVGADKLDDTILEALARKGDGRYYLLDKPEDADAGFAKQLAGALRPAASNVKVQVEFNPNRVKTYKLLGFEKHLLKKEDFRNDKVDAAEMAAQEAGSAMYQFEPIAGGKGDVGRVFVRFRDMTSGKMVERSWAIPYQPQPDVIEEAAPSMQLATTAAMLAEKIRSTDVGLVDFSEYAKVLGNLNEHYSEDEKVQDLIRMVRFVK